MSKNNALATSIPHPSPLRHGFIPAGKREAYVEFLEMPS